MLRRSVSRNPGPRTNGKRHTRRLVAGPGRAIHLRRRVRYSHGGLEENRRWPRSPGAGRVGIGQRVKSPP